MRFFEKWKNVVERLRSDLSPSVLKKERIDFGKYGEKPSNPPFIYVYMEPAINDKLESGASKENKATIIIACGVPAAINQAESLSASVDLAHLALDSLKNFKLKSKIEVDGVYNSAAVSFFELETSYESPKLEITT